MAKPAPDAPSTPAPVVEEGQRIEYMKLDDLVEAARNAKLHDLDEIGLSVDELGFTTELKLDERTGQLIRGHGRLALLRRLRDRAAEAPEGIRELGGDWAAPVVRGWSSRDDRHAEAAAIADNQIGKTTGYDPAVLLDQLADLAADAPNLLRATGHSSEDLDRLLAEVNKSTGGTIVTNLDGLGSALAPWDQETTDPFTDRPSPPETSHDEQWDTGQTIVDPEDRPEPPAPPGSALDVAPAWRTLQPTRAIFHTGGPDGARTVMDWLRGHATDIRAEDGDVVLWHDQDGDWQLLPGGWCTRDGQTGRFELYSTDEFYARWVPANEPARRVQKAAESSKVNARGGTQ